MKSERVNHEIEVVDQYKYMGIWIGRSGAFAAAKKHIADKALWKRLRIRSVISVNYHYITVLCPLTY